MRKIFSGLAALLMLAVIFQFFLAGSGAFDAAPTDEAFAPHRAVGFLILLLAAVTTVMAAVARMPGRLIGLTGLVVGLAVLQPVIAGIASTAGEAGGGTTRAGELIFGLHAVNGLVIMGILGTVVRRSRAVAKSPDDKAGAVASPPSVSQTAEPAP